MDVMGKMSLKTMTFKIINVMSFHDIVYFSGHGFPSKSLERMVMAIHDFILILTLNSPLCLNIEIFYSHGFS